MKMNIVELMVILKTNWSTLSKTLNSPMLDFRDTEKVRRVLINIFHLLITATIDYFLCIPNANRLWRLLQYNVIRVVQKDGSEKGEFMAI